MAYGAWRGLAVIAVLFTAAPALAQVTPPTDPVWDTYSVFDLPLGKHARELSFDRFMDYACGTNGGPPSRPVASFADFKQCPPEPETGLREVYYRYDDEAEYWARAYDLPNKVALFRGTTAFGFAIIASGLIDAEGRLVGLRIVSDPRAETSERSRAAALRNFFMARYDLEDGNCEDLPRDAREAPFGSIYIKQHCAKTDTARNLRVTIDTRHFRKAGQFAFDPNTRELTEGQFESSTRFEMSLIEPAAAPLSGRIAAAPALTAGPAEADFVAGRSRTCAGCNLAGAQLKRRDLAGANLAGANLVNANLHDAKLAGADLAGADLSAANLNKADLRRAQMATARLVGATLYAARLEAADLSGAELMNAKLGAARMTRARLAGAALGDADLRHARLDDATLVGANLSGAWFDDAAMKRADLSGAVLTGARFVGTELNEANLSGAQATGADFFQADLTDANLRDADLSGARLQSALVIRTGFAGAKMTGTILPDGTVQP